MVLYDPNPANPYGRELARVLQREHRVTLYSSPAASWVPSGVQVHRVLASSRADDGLPLTIARRAWGPLRVLITAVLGGQTLVVVWIRHSWDAIVFAVAAKLGASIVVIAHNPAAIRPLAGMIGRAEAKLKRAAPVVVVLAQELVDSALLESNNVIVAPHPSFLGWRERYLRTGSLQTGPCDDRRRLLLLGALRPDKGAGEVPAVVRAVQQHSVTIVLAGRGDPPKGWREEVYSAGGAVDAVGSGGFVDDDALARVLKGVDLIVAPYVGATQSSTVVLALTCDVPTIAYRTGGLTALLNERSLTPLGDPQAMGARIDQYLSAPWATWETTAGALDDSAADGWREALAAVRARSCGSARPSSTSQ